MKTETIRVGGMTCINCRNRIEQALKSAAGIDDAVVDFNAGTARVTYDETAVTPDGVAGIIKKLGYTTGERGGAPPLKAAGTLIIIIALYILLRGLGAGALSRAFPAAEAGMGYGMLFVIGLLTSFHCAAMCGGINLSQCLGGPPAAPPPNAAKRRVKTLAPAILYNCGRAASYTLTGAIVGALGSVVSVTGRMAGAVQIAAGAFMVVMGLNMLGIFPSLRRFMPRLPQIFTKKTDGRRAGGKNPLFIGLLNGLMPCGPLQAMQLYALSTGNAVAGAFSMFLFAMGTVPLMFALGALGSFLNDSAKGPAFTRRVIQAGAVLVTVMGMTMFGYGVNLSGVNFDFPGSLFAAERQYASKTERAGGGAAFAPDLEDGVQVVKSTLSGGRYPAITVLRGIPVRWTINAPAGSINGCNNRMIIREYGVEYRFKQGDNVIEFTPERSGKFVYSCWMGMIRSSITVLEEGDIPDAADVEPNISPVPAGVAISAETVLPAESAGGGSYQTISTRLLDDGIEPAVIVVQRSLPAVWTITRDSLDPGNSRLIFPAYYTRVDIEQGENIIRLLPDEDFDFSTADNVFYGFVKVVDDLNNIDIEAVRAEAASHETLIYPDAYFETGAGGGCCAR